MRDGESIRSVRFDRFDGLVGNERSFGERLFGERLFGPAAPWVSDACMVQVIPPLPPTVALKGVPVMTYLETYAPEFALGLLELCDELADETCKVVPG